MNLRTSVLAISLLALPLLANAQTQNPMAESLIKAGGQGQVLAEGCSNTSAQEINEAKEKQKNLAVQGMGVSEAQFHQWYSEGLQEGRAKWQSMSQSERQQSCKEIFEIGRALEG